MRLQCYLLLILFTAFFSGCGGGANNPVSNANEVSKLAASQTCMNLSCHGAMVNPVTGGVIAQEWLASTHNTKNGAGCADCHEPDAGHPNLCNKCHGGGGFGVTINPDQSGKCGKCHGLNHPQDVMMQLSPQHFGNLTTSYYNSTYRASYISSNYVGNCRKCHNPHDTSSAHQVNADWAASGHAIVTHGTRVNYDFKTRGTYEPANLTFQYYCVRCHTTTGYIDFVTSGFTNQRPFAGPGFAVVQNAPVKVAPGVAQPADRPSPDKSKEVTNCNACHDDGNGNAYGFQVRAVPAIKVYYNFSSSNSSPTVKLNNKPVYYPDAGPSNHCVACHVGRGIGSLVYDAVAQGMDFTNTNSPSSHDRAVGTVLYQKGGYEFVGRNYSNSSFQHSSIGMNNFNGSGTSGPCVTCHMKSGNSHSFYPVSWSASGTISGIIVNSCTSCHASLPTPLSASSLEADREGYAAAVAMLSVLRYDPTLPTDPLNPSKSKVRPLPNKNSNYDAPFPGGGANTMGALFNLGLLQNELGAFAHNSLYTKRLIYDSIDWLSNGAMDNDVESAINNATLAVNSSTGKVSLANPIMGGYYIAPQVPSSAYAATFAAVKQAAINYLIGGPGGSRP